LKALFGILVLTVAVGAGKSENSPLLEEFSWFPVLVRIVRMSVILYAVGAFAALAGVAMIGFGIPDNAFGIGNTLITAGVTALVGGLIVASLGVVVAQLQRLAEALISRTPARAARPLDNMFGAAGSRDMTGVQFPARPKADAREPYSLEPRVGAPAPADMRADETSAPPFAPALRNPEESEVTVEDDVSLSPRHPMAGRQMAADLDEPARNMSFGHESAATEPREEPMLDANWRPSPRPAPATPAPVRKSHSTYFDAMWPAESKPAKEPESRPVDAEVEPFVPTFEPPQHEPVAEPAAQAEPEAPAPENEPQPVAILKSGVVDGMGYTLYVDGSIEAELPQGTLRFASINELRAHLEKNA
jgi:hypothetical protein